MGTDVSASASSGDARHLLLRVLAVVALAACGQDTGADTPVEGGALSIDGLLLIHDTDHRVLFDPATGKLGPSMPGAFSIAPDLGHIVRRDDTASVVVEAVGRAADGTPTLTTSATLAFVGNSGPYVLGEAAPAFNAQGDRVAGAGWWNPTTDEHLPTAGSAVSPDGRHHIGSTEVGDLTVLLYDDFEPVMPLHETYFTSDGQWLVATDGLLGEYFWLSHVPTLTTVLRPDADRPDRGFLRPVETLGNLRIPYRGSDPRGRLLFAADGRRGLIIPEPCGFPPDLQGPIAPITVLAPAAVADGHTTPLETPLEALNALPKETDADGVPYHGFAWTVLGITPDGAAAIVQHQWYNLVAGEGTFGCKNWQYVPKTLDIFRVELGGTGALQPQVRMRQGDGPGVEEAIALGCASSLDPTEPLAFRLRRAAGLQFLTETDWLCGSEDATFAAYIDGKGRVMPMPGAWPALDRASLVGPAPSKAAAVYGDARVTTGLCQGPFAGGATGCLVPLDLWWSRHVVAQVGIDLVPRASTGPVVAALSHRAALPGTIVRVLGYGFGTSGVLQIGDVAVPTEAISTWSDKAVAFTMPANAPDIGMMRVTDASGNASTQRHVWLGRSEPWTGAPVVPSGPFELRQGVNRIAFSGAGAFTVGLKSLDPIFPGGDLPTVPEGVGPDHVDALVTTSPIGRTVYPWITFRSARGLTFRPLTVRPGIPDDPPWQPIGGSFVDGARFVMTAGVLHLLGPYGPASAIDPGGPDHDWAVNAFTPTNLGGFRDGDDAWRASGPVLERLTAWSVLDGGVRAPVFTPEITTPFATGLTSYAVHGDVVVATVLENQSGQQYGTMHVSVNRGADFAEVIPSTRWLWTTWSAVVAGPRPGIYGTVSRPDADGVMVERVARVTPDGTLEVSATVPRTPGGEVGCGLGFVVFGNRLLCHDQPKRRLYAVDVSSADGPGWEEVGGALAGHIASFFVDAATGALLVGSDTGGIWQTADLATWTQRDQVMLGPITMPLVVQALGVMPDGAWVTLIHHESWSNGGFIVRAKYTSR